MTGEEKDLLKKYLTHLNVLGKDGSHPHFEAWYQEVRYAQGPNAPQTLMEASELRYKDVLDAARVFNRLQKNPYPSSAGYGRRSSPSKVATSRAL